jgi:hypothetical protein
MKEQDEDVVNIENYINYLKAKSELTKIEDGFLLIKIPEYGYYEISLNDCNTFPKILEWSFRLLEKSWTTKEIVEAFMARACSYHKLPLFGEHY